MTLNSPFWDNKSHTCEKHPHLGKVPCPLCILGEDEDISKVYGPADIYVLPYNEGHPVFEGCEPQ